MSAPHPATVGKPCRVCGEAIKSVARKCIHCSSFQDWRGGLGLSSEMLALLVALFAVCTPILQWLSTPHPPNRSDLTATFQNSTGKNLVAFVANSGGKPGTVTSVQLDVSSKYGDSTFFLVPDSPDGTLVVQGQASVLGRFRPDTEKFTMRRVTFGAAAGSSQEHLKRLLSMPQEQEYVPIIGSDVGAKCAVRYQFSNFDGSRSERTETVKCRSVENFAEPIGELLKGIGRLNKKRAP